MHDDSPSSTAGMGHNGGPALDKDKLVDMAHVRRFWGGDEDPVDPATIYRLIKAGEHPRPIKIGRLSRWLESELVAERNRRRALRK